MPLGILPEGMPLDYLLPHETTAGKHNEFANPNPRHAEIWQDR